jgi:hypothetical protein
MTTAAVLGRADIFHSHDFRMSCTSRIKKSLPGYVAYPAMYEYGRSKLFGRMSDLKNSDQLVVLSAQAGETHLLRTRYCMFTS